MRVFIVFFFFKQKTAYEMRISDWSSDVCSSDLGARAGSGGPKQYRPLAGEAVLARTARAFLDHPGVDAVRVIIHGDDGDLYAEAMAGLLHHKKLLDRKSVV